MGKTPVPAREGQQSDASRGSPDEKRGKFHSLMGQVLDLRRLRTAYEAVRSNRGEPGDGVTVEAFGEDLAANLDWFRLFLEALIQEGYRLVRPRAGTPQGGSSVPCWRTSTWPGWIECSMRTA